MPPAEVTQCCLVHCRFPRVQHITVLRYVDREREREREREMGRERDRDRPRDGETKKLTETEGQKCIPVRTGRVSMHDSAPAVSHLLQ